MFDCSRVNTECFTVKKVRNKQEPYRNIAIVTLVSLSRACHEEYIFLISGNHGILNVSNENKMAIKDFFYLVAFLTCCGIITQLAAKVVEKPKSTTVLILGGGISGIAAAKTLSDHGIKDFIILEGTDRIGGRMRKMQFFNTTIELGANWIQGVKNNPITDLALICGLKGKLENGNFVIRNESGFNTTMKGNMAQLKRSEDILDKIRLHRRKLHKGDISIRVALRLANWLPVTPEEDATEYFQYDFEYAVPPKYISLRTWIADNGSIHSVGGEQFFVTDPRGYVHIVDCLADMFLEPKDPRLQLNTTVTVACAQTKLNSG